VIIIINIENIKTKIAKLEEKIETELPQDYKDFLMNLEKDFITDPKYQGLSGIHEYKVEYLHKKKPIPAYHTFNAQNPESKWPKFLIINLYSLIEQSPYDLFNAYEIFQANKDETSKNFLPFADNGYGDEVCICIKGKNQGKIYVCAHDQDYKLILLAQSFTEFLSLSKKEK